MYDVIIVGAGTGGSLAAKTAAKLGLKVCLIDSRPADRIGDKICGEAIEERDLLELGIMRPQGDECANCFEALNFYAPDQKYRVSIKDKGYIVNRLQFGQRLLKEAINAGVELLDQWYVTQPLIGNRGFITGIIARHTENQAATEQTAKIVIDASGIHSTLRKDLPSLYGRSYPLAEEQLVCYREILRVSRLDYSPNQMHLFFSNTNTPGGYGWIFPKEDGIVNIGVAISGDHCHNLKENYKRNILPLIKDASIPIHQGGGIVSVRYPLWSLVDNGLMYVGDAAFQANPIHGGGIGPSMRAGIYAAEEAAKAMEAGDYSIDQLWGYNQRFAKETGTISMALAVMRLLLYRLSDNDLNAIFKYRLFTWEDFTGIIFGKFRNILQFHPLDIFGRLIRGHQYLRIMDALVVTNDIMNRVHKLYRAYPLRSNFERWKKETLKLYNYVDRFTQRLQKKEN